jgi:hypothetical protein
MTVFVPRTRRALVFALAPLLLSLAGCKSDAPPPAPVIAVEKPELSPETSQKIDDAIAMLNNSNVEEHWLKQLIECAQSDELARRAAIDRTVATVKQSYAAVQVGQQRLRAEGRTRAMIALDKFGGTEPAVMEVFKLGAKDGSSEVASAASAALAARGDESSFSSLLASVKSARNDRSTQDRAAQGLIKLAKPEKRDEILAAMDAGCRDALAPVASACLPAEPEPRAQALQGIARQHPNPQARIYAIDELRKANDPEIVDFAHLQANAEDADLRGYALQLLAAQGAKVAAVHLADVLAAGAREPDTVAKLLAGEDAPETLSRASDLLADSSKPATTRAACARFVLGRLKDESAPACFKDPAAREHALSVLRRAILDKNDAVADAAIEALGASGDESDAESLCQLLNDEPQHAKALVTALGRIGGALAVETLVSLHKNDPKLRPACRDALVGMKGLRAIDFNQGNLLIQQLRSTDLETRKSALAILRVLKGDSDIHDYDPESDAAARNRSVERWVTWWREKVAQRGG